MKKRALSLFLAITLCLTLTPTGALAEESLPEQTVVATQEAQTGAGENAPPANPAEDTRKEINPLQFSAAMTVRRTAARFQST